MRENSRQLDERAERRRAGRHDARAPRLLHDDVPDCARLIAKAACFLYDLQAVTWHTDNDY